MNIIDIRCQDAINSPINCCHFEHQDCPLLLNENWQIYLFFDLPGFLSSKKVKEARLLLYKAPPFAYDCECADDKYTLYPLLDFFSIYNCAFCPPDVDKSRKVRFGNDVCKSYTEIDITCIVKDWLDLTIENKGLLLTGNKHSHNIYFESDESKIIGMRPTLRIKYDEKYTPALSSVPCDVVVNRPNL